MGYIQPKPPLVMNRILNLLSLIKQSWAAITIAVCCLIFDSSLSTLTVIGLNSNTTYFFQVGSLNHNDVPHFVSADSTSTLAEIPTAPGIVSVFVSSDTLGLTAPKYGA